MNPLFVVGNKRQVNEADLLGVAGKDDPLVVSREFEKRLDALMAAGDPEPVRNALIAQFRGRMIRAGLVKLLNSTLNFAPSLLLYGLLSSLQNGGGTMFSNLPWWSGYAFAVSMFFAMMARTFVVSGGAGEQAGGAGQERRGRCARCWPALTLDVSLSIPTHARRRTSTSTWWCAAA